MRRQAGFVPMAYWAAACSVARRGGTGPIRELLDDLAASDFKDKRSIDGPDPDSP
jgi:hypothetical protein